MKRNKKYEKEIKNMFLNCVKEIDISLSVENKRSMLYCLIREPHFNIFSQYENIYTDNLYWADYNGIVVCQYQFIYTIKFITFKFNYPKQILQ